MDYSFSDFLRERREQGSVSRLQLEIYRPSDSSLCSSEGSHDADSRRDPDEDISVNDLMYALYPFQKRKRIRYTHKRAVPKLLQSDLRRHYANILFNVLNSHDYSIMQSFSERYLASSVIMRRPGVRTELVEKPSVLVEGSETLLRYWGVLCLLLPDQISQVENVRVVRYSNSERSKVVCDVVSSCTQIYQHHDCSEILLNDRTYPSSADSEIFFATTLGGVEYRSRKRLRGPDAESDIAKVVSFGPLHIRMLPRPMKVQLAMTVTLHINEFYQISEVEYGTVTVAY